MEIFESEMKTRRKLGIRKRKTKDYGKEGKQRRRMTKQKRGRG